MSFKHLMIDSNSFFWRDENNDTFAILIHQLHGKHREEVAKEKHGIVNGNVSAGKIHEKAIQ